jgi:SAM-dependent methyltransferase
MSNDAAPPPQNIYDDPTFFAGYATMPRFGDGWTSAVEHADFMALLPEPRGLRALDLGCGNGQLAQYLGKAGAQEVIGVDISAKMLAVARAERQHPNVTYQQSPLETLAFPDDRFELVVSSLAFHYVADYAGLVQRIGRWLVSGGVLVFTNEHPIYTAGEASGDGWGYDAARQKRHWAVNDYADEGLRLKNWYVEGVQKYHRTVSTLLNGLLDAGLSIERVREPVPSVEAIAARPAWADERQRPIFVVVRARKQ